jgi:hypothetical protein
MSCQPPISLKFISNGRMSGTRVYDATTGVEILGVKKISFEADAETGIIRACMELVNFTWQFLAEECEAPKECHTCSHLLSRDTDHTLYLSDADSPDGGNTVDSL